MSGECDVWTSTLMITGTIQEIKKSGLLDEFHEFYLNRIRAYGSAPVCFDSIALEAAKDFAKLHPDKFHVPDDNESYGKFVVFI